MPSSPGLVGFTRVAFRMTIGHPRPWPGYPRHTGLISATAVNSPTVSCSSYPRFRHQLSSDPASRRAPLPRRMVPVITVHRGLAPLECTSLLDTPGEIACPTMKDRRFTKLVGQAVSPVGTSATRSIQYHGGGVLQQRQCLFHGEDYAFDVCVERVVLSLFSNATERQACAAAGVRENRAFALLLAFNDLSIQTGRLSARYAQ